MPEKRLVMLRGIPASGKSRRAKELVAQGFIRVNRDDLRISLNGGKFTRSNEKLIVKVRDHIIREALLAGRSVCDDNTNMPEKNATHLRQLAKECGAQFEVEEFHVDLHTAIERDAQREHSVGETVIRSFWNQWVRPGLAVEVFEDLPSAIICDIDGTLATMVDRSPYDFMRAGEDLLNHNVANLIAAGLAEHIIIMSGRDEECRDVTVDWLKRHGVGYSELLMRSRGDVRKDTVAKRELYDKYVHGKYRVLYAVDDRFSVVDMWRDLGFQVFQVADGRF